MLKYPKHLRLFCFIPINKTFFSVNAMWHTEAISNFLLLGIFSTYRYANRNLFTGHFWLDTKSSYVYTHPRMRISMRMKKNWLLSLDYFSVHFFLFRLWSKCSKGHSTNRGWKADWIFFRRDFSQTNDFVKPKRYLHVVDLYLYFKFIKSVSTDA